MADGLDRDWIVRVDGTDQSLAFWLSKLSPRDGVYFEILDVNDTPLVVLRASGFGGLGSADEVLEYTGRTLDLLRFICPADFDAHPLKISSISKIVDGQHKGWQYFQSASIEAKSHVHLSGVVMNAVGKVRARLAPRLPRGDRQADRLRKGFLLAAQLDERLAKALLYLHGEPGWIEYYKACEVLWSLPTPGIAEREKERLKRTANVYRHHRTPSAPKVPMTLSEASGFIELWLDVAVAQVLMRHGRTQ